MKKLSNLQLYSHVLKLNNDITRAYEDYYEAVLDKDDYDEDRIKEIDTDNSRSLLEKSCMKKALSNLIKKNER